eukprot:UN08326
MSDPDDCNLKDLVYTLKEQP